MKRVLKYLPYLPVILIGIAATVVVIHMWHVTYVARARVGGSKRSHGTLVEVRQTPSVSPAQPLTP
jgi:hypothetical protein